MRKILLASAVFSLFLCSGASEAVAADDAITYRNRLVDLSGHKVFLCNQTPDNPPNGYSPITPTEVGLDESFTLPASAWTNLAVRIAGCAMTDAYIATIGLTAPSTSGGNGQLVITPQNAQPPSSWANTSVSIKKQTSGTMSFSNGPIKGRTVAFPYTTNSLTSPQTYKGGLVYRGINLSGSEFGCSWEPDNSPTAYELEAYVAEGVNTVRIPVRWAYLQNRLQIGTKDIDKTYASFLISMLEQVTAKKIYSIIDLHSYMRFSPAGQHVAGFFAPGSNPCNLNPPPTAEGTQYPDGTSYTLKRFGGSKGTLATGTATGAVWVGLLQAISKNTNIDQQYLMLDLTNEPNNMQTSTVWTNTVDIVTALQEAVPDFVGKVLIEGNQFTGLHSWDEEEAINGPSGQAGVGTESTANNGTYTQTGFASLQAMLPKAEFFLNVHQYFDSDYSGTQDTCQAWSALYSNSGQQGGLNFASFMQAVKANKFKVIVTEFGGSTDSSCTTDLKNFVALLQDNAYTETNGYGFVGWTLWGGGHAWGGASAYNQYAGPDGPQMAALANPQGNDNGGLTPLVDCFLPPRGPFTLGIVNQTGGNLTVYVDGTEGSTGLFYPSTNNAPIGVNCVGLLGKSSKLSMNGSAGYLGIVTDASGNYSYSYSENDTYTFTSTSSTACGSQVRACYSITH